MSQRNPIPKVKIHKIAQPRNRSPSKKNFHLYPYIIFLLLSIASIAPTFGVSGIFLNNLPTWRENDVDINKIFIEQSKEVAKFLSREIEVVKAFVEGRNILLKDYETAQDKRIIITETNFPRYLYQETLSSLVEPLYVVMPSGHNYWKIEAISKSPTLMESRKPFPESWRGFSDDDARLREVTGIEDMRFCHRSGYLAGTYSKESAIKLAEKALLA